MNFVSKIKMTAEKTIFCATCPFVYCKSKSRGRCDHPHCPEELIEVSLDGAVEAPEECPRRHAKPNVELRPYWMVDSPVGSVASKQRYDSEDKAWSAAEVFLDQYPGGVFFVMKAVGVLHSPRIDAKRVGFDD